jgi:two-component system cell cycle sensor histidine kinase/response regulator CckA
MTPAWHKFQRVFQRMMDLPPDTVRDELRSWRERVLVGLLVSALTLGMFALAGSLWLIIERRLWLLVVIDLAIYLSGFWLLIQRIPFQVRASVAALMTYGLGLSILLFIGPVIGGLAWLFAFAVFTAVLLGLRSALAAVALNAATVIGVELLALTGFFGPPTGESLSLRLANGVNFVFLNAVVAVSVAVLVRGLESTIIKEKKAQNELSEERRQLVEVNVRLYQEIGDRQLAQEALKRSEAKYRLLADNVRDNIWVLRLADLRFTYVSPSVRDILGYTPEEALNLNLEEMLTPDSLGLFTEFLKGELADGGRRHDPTRSRTLELEQYRRDGSTIWVEISTTFMTDSDGRPDEVLGVTRDITERKLAEAALRESQERYLSILEASPDPVVLNDTDGNVVYINPAFTRVFGWTLDDLSGQQIDFVPEEDWVATNRRLQQIKRGRSFHGFETRRLNKEGKLLDISMSAAAWRDSQGRPSGSVITLRDVTEHKKMEAQLQHARKMEAVGTLAGGVAHDFNNVLQAISGYVQLMLRRKAPGDNEVEHLEAIDRAIGRAGLMINQLLTVSRKLESRPEPVDLGRLVADVCRLLERTVPRMIEIEIHGAADLRPVSADPTQLEQIILNLGGNARDAMPDGGKLVFTIANLEIKPGGVLPHAEIDPGTYVTLAVSDTGMGMDAQTVEHIFEPFFSTKQPGKGTGLGLATVYGIVKKHNGHITCDTGPGWGTTFTIYLPALMGEQAVVEAAHDEDVAVQGGPETVLVVDDETSILDVGREILEEYGYTALVATSGEEALKIYREQPVDLVILDLNMPGMGGQKCLERLREIDPDARVVIASGYSAETASGKAIRAQVDGYIDKPYRLHDLLHMVRQVLDGGPLSS